MVKRVSIIGHVTGSADAFTGVERELTIDTTRGEVRVHDGETQGGIPQARRDLVNILASVFLAKGVASGLATEADLDAVGDALDALITAHNAAAATLSSHVANTSNPHTVTKAQVGLTNVTDHAQLKAASNLSDVADATTAFANIKQNATDAATGVVELAIGSEVETGSDAARAITPKALKDMATLANMAWLIDEDNMVSDSAVKVPSQQSVKAYVDALNLLTLDAQKATTSGTTKDFTIPAGTKRITVMFKGVSGSGTDNILVQLGDVDGIKTTGYVSNSGRAAASGTGTTSTAGFIIESGNALSNTISGHMILTLMDAATFQWVSSHAISAAINTGAVGGGDKALPKELTTVRVTFTGANTFDAGAVNVLTE